MGWVVRWSQQLWPSKPKACEVISPMPAESTFEDIQYHRSFPGSSSCPACHQGDSQAQRACKNRQDDTGGQEVRLCERREFAPIAYSARSWMGAGSLSSASSVDSGCSIPSGWNDTGQQASACAELSSSVPPVFLRTGASAAIGFPGRRPWSTGRGVCRPAIRRLSGHLGRRSPGCGRCGSG